MNKWEDLYVAYLSARWPANSSSEDIQQAYAWIVPLHQRASEIMSEETLSTMEPAAVYGHLRELSVPECPIRVANLGRVNQAADVVEALRLLATTPGDFSEKYKSAKIPQTGKVTITELLCVLRPHRFMIRNTAVLRALVKVIPFYTKRGFEELPYEEYLDLCRELTKVQDRFFSPMGLGEWSTTYRFLLLYALLVEKR